MKSGMESRIEPWMESGMESGVESGVSKASQRHEIEKGGQPWMRRPCGGGAPGCFDPSGYGRKSGVKKRRPQGRGMEGSPGCDDPVETQLPDASTRRAARETEKSCIPAKHPNSIPAMDSGVDSIMDF